MHGCIVSLPDLTSLKQVVMACWQFVKVLNAPASTVCFSAGTVVESVKLPTGSSTSASARGWQQGQQRQGRLRQCSSSSSILIRKATATASNSKQQQQQQQSVERATDRPCVDGWIGCFFTLTLMSLCVLTC